MAAPTLVSRVHTTPCDPGFSSGPFVSGSFNAVAGNLIVVLAAQDSYTTRPITTCTDTAGNTYTKAAYVATTGTRAIACWYCLSSAAKTSNVVTLTNTGGSLSEKGTSVLQFNAGSGTWTHVGGAGYTAGAYNGTATTGSLNMTGAGVVAEYGTGDEDQTSSTWNFTAGCSDFYGSASSPDDTGEGSGIVGADLLSAANASHTFTATFANTHSLLGQWGFVASGGASGAISGTANLGFTATATLAAAGALVGAAALSLSATATAVGKAALAGAANLALGAAATLKGAATLAGSAALTLAATATLGGGGALAGSAGLAFTATGTATAYSDALVGSAPLTFTATGSLAGSEALIGSAPLAFTAGGTLSGNGALTGAAPLAFTATARPNGSSALSGTANLAFASTGTATAAAAISGAGNLAFTATGTLSAASSLGGTASIVLAANGAMQGSGVLAGNAALGFTATGTLTNGIPVFPVDPRYYAAIGLRPFYVSANARNFYVMANPNITPVLDTKDPRESVVVTLDGSNDLADGETLTTVEKTDVTVIAGNDADQSLVVGTPEVNGAPVTVQLPNGQTVTVATGKGVQAEVSAGLTNCRYLIAITCNTNNPDKVLTLKGILPVSAS